MRLKFEIFFSLVVFTIFLTISCKKNSISAPPDSGGTVLDKEVYFDSLSASFSTLQFQYNSSGDLISIGSANPMGGDSLIYSAPGKLSRYKAGNAWEAMMVYDSNEHIVGVKYSYSMSRALAYDNRNRVIGDTSYDGSGNIVSYDTFSYDNDDNITSFQELRITTGGIFTDGPVIVVYDHHPNPHAKFGKLIYYADGDFRYSFKENSISEKAGSYEEKVPPDVVYKYYSDGQLWQESSHMDHRVITYYYK